VITLTISYNFNNYKPDRRQNREVDAFEGEGEEF
jgi:hypothetical protein